MTHKVRLIIISVLIAIGFLTIACEVEGGAPGREVCYGCQK